MSSWSTLFRSSGFSWMKRSRVAPCDVTTCCYPLPPLSPPRPSRPFLPSLLYCSRSRSRISLLQVVNGSYTEGSARVRKSKSPALPKGIANNIRNDSRYISCDWESAGRIYARRYYLLNYQQRIYPNTDGLQEVDHQTHLTGSRLKSSLSCEYSYAETIDRKYLRGMKSWTVRCMRKFVQFETDSQNHVKKFGADVFLEIRTRDEKGKRSSFLFLGSSLRGCPRIVSREWYTLYNRERSQEPTLSTVDRMDRRSVSLPTGKLSKPTSGEQAGRGRHLLERDKRHADSIPPLFMWIVNDKQFIFHEPDYL